MKMINEIYCDSYKRNSHSVTKEKDLGLYI